MDSILCWLTPPQHRAYRSWSQMTFAGCFLSSGQKYNLYCLPLECSSILETSSCSTVCQMEVVCFCLCPLYVVKFAVDSLEVAPALFTRPYICQHSFQSFQDPQQELCTCQSVILCPSQSCTNFLILYTSVTEFILLVPLRLAYLAEHFKSSCGMWHNFLF